MVSSCICLYSYIKPQPTRSAVCATVCCICLYSYIKPQHEAVPGGRGRRCICLYSYIKPQHYNVLKEPGLVVYVSIPTSNHNTERNWVAPFEVVYVSIPTSNHNGGTTYNMLDKLYMSLFLHQTTTRFIILEIILCCICLYSYIKPQLSTGAKK